jgi:hypothetical protein
MAWRPVGRVVLSLIKRSFYQTLELPDCRVIGCFGLRKSYRGSNQSKWPHFRRIIGCILFADNVGSERCLLAVCK